MVRGTTYMIVYFQLELWDYFHMDWYFCLRSECSICALCFGSEHSAPRYGADT